MVAVNPVLWHLIQMFWQSHLITSNLRCSDGCEVAYIQCHYGTKIKRCEIAINSLVALNPVIIRTHSSRMRTVRCSSQLRWGYLPRGCLAGGCLPGGVSAQSGSSTHTPSCVQKHNLAATTLWTVKISLATFNSRASCSNTTSSYRSVKIDRLV